ncbi:hypothetical protein [Alkalihalobacterium alkalinitrilicum]|uniref:hypothetical protein n=1 Tax=Alkalihalobacterium alkalinitrilicum TaxID=427920 RepID=UPI001303B1B6|nr:hypothetical protein [Alkalihalobacterium alkalinitrilicum]
MKNFIRLVLFIISSVVKLEGGPNSELDLLVEFKEGRSLFDLIRFKQEIEELLK